MEDVLRQHLPPPLQRLVMTNVFNPRGLARRTLRAWAAHEFRVTAIPQVVKKLKLTTEDVTVLAGFDLRHMLMLSLPPLSEKEVNDLMHGFKTTEKKRGGRCCPNGDSARILFDVAFHGALMPLIDRVSLGFGSIDTYGFIKHRGLSAVALLRDFWGEPQPPLQYNEAQELERQYDALYTE